MFVNSTVKREFLTVHATLVQQKKSYNPKFKSVRVTQADFLH
jgi:hypothetical protein